jgi:hypothetical protein
MGECFACSQQNGHVATTDLAREGGWVGWEMRRACEGGSPESVGPGSRVGFYTD